MGNKILIIDDHEEMLTMLSTLFAHEGVEPILAKNGQEGLRKFYEHRPDLVILDIMMPDQDGWQVFNEIRNLSDKVPIIFYSALKNDATIVRGLDIGAVDFVPKPTSFKVLMARVRAALRSTNPRQAVSPEPDIFFDGYLTIDLEKRLVMKNDQPVHLTRTEFKILSYLYKHKGFVLTFSQILNHIWDQVNDGTEASLYVYISRLRQKIEKDPTEPQYILTEYGTGYRFANSELNLD